MARRDRRGEPLRCCRVVEEEVVVVVDEEGGVGGVGGGLYHSSSRNNVNVEQAGDRCFMERRLGDRRQRKIEHE